MVGWVWALTTQVMSFARVAAYQRVHFHSTIQRIRETMMQFADNHPWIFLIVVYIFAMCVTEAVSSISKIFRKRP